MSKNMIYGVVAFSLSAAFIAGAAILLVPDDEQPNSNVSNTENSGSHQLSLEQRQSIKAEIDAMNEYYFGGIGKITEKTITIRDIFETTLVGGERVRWITDSESERYVCPLEDSVRLSDSCFALREGQTVMANVLKQGSPWNHPYRITALLQGPRDI